MARNILAGLVLAALTAVVTAFQLLGSQPGVLLGLVLGGALGLVPGTSVAGRAGGFVLGAVLAWAGYLLRAGALPDSAAGRAVVAFVVVALCTAGVAVSRGRLPLWSTLLGVAAVVGAYESVYATDPSAVTTTSVQVVTTVLLAAAFGLLGALVVPARGPGARHAGPASDEPRTPTAADEAYATQPPASSSPVTLHPLTRDPQEA